MDGTSGSGVSQKGRGQTQRPQQQGKASPGVLGTQGSWASELFPGLGAVVSSAMQAGLQ